MVWAVELSATAEKELRRLPRDRRARIDAAIDEMERDPLAGDVKPLKGHEWKGHSRKRVGPYRIIFTMDRNTMTVAISAILHSLRKNLPIAIFWPLPSMKRDSRVRASLGAMPHMLVALDWDTVKQFFLREVPRLF